MARKIYRRTRFDAILSFGLSGAGGIAWRLGRDLALPAGGWATGSDVRQRLGTSFHRAVSRTLRHLDVVFYQSQELLEKAAELLALPLSRLSPDRHLVLPRGIPEPPILPRTEIRSRMRRELRVTDEQVLVLSVGRISRDKGAFELMEAVSLAAEHDLKITCVMLGANPAFDETTAIQRQLDKSPHLKEIIKILPACHPERVWEFLAAADVFAFTSHNEGMPNSLLEAMAVGVPAIAFSIPPVLEIENDTGALVAVPPFDSALFAKAILDLAAVPNERVRIGEIGRRRVQQRFMIKQNMATALNRLAQELPEENLSAEMQRQDIV
ncbi:MAG: glycosyltransferase [Deltaproteobacteria bacterium]|nr:glycosyltransferase [Deltaproteobacteria bacterium]